MNLFRLCLLLTAGLAATACVPRREPPPQPAPAPSPTPQPPAPPPAPPGDWRDVPLTSGGWSYDAGRSLAAFGAPGSPSFTFRCDRARRQIVLTRAGAGAGMLTVRTTSIARNLTGSADGAALAANDSLLDAIVFSRGRFMVSAPNAPALFIPTWPEPARVIEDCRA